MSGTDRLLEGENGKRLRASIAQLGGEREAIVAWLRTLAPLMVRQQETILLHAADNIETGAHLSDKFKDFLHPDYRYSVHPDHLKDKSE